MVGVTALPPKPHEEQPQPRSAQGRQSRRGRAARTGPARRSLQPVGEPRQRRCFQRETEGQEVSLPLFISWEKQTWERLGGHEPVQALPKPHFALNAPLIFPKRVRPRARDGEGNHQASPMLSPVVEAGYFSPGMPREDEGWLHPSATSPAKAALLSPTPTICWGGAIKPEGLGQSPAKPDAPGATLQAPKKFTSLPQGPSSSPESTRASDVAADKEPFYLEP